MKTEQLIHSLLSDARSVRRLKPAAERCAYWVGFALLSVAAGVTALGLRADLAEKARDAAFLGENAALFLAFVSAARSAFELGVPDDERSVSTFFLPLLSIALWFLLVLLLGWHGLEGGGFGLDSKSGLPCVWRVLGLGVLPLALCWRMLRAAAPQEQRWTGLCMLLSAAAVAVLGTQLLCTSDGALHVLLWHGAPLIVLAGLGGYCGTSAFRGRST